MNKYEEALNILTNIFAEFDQGVIIDITPIKYKKGFDSLNMFQELVNKETPKKPRYEGDGYDRHGNIIYDTWICPNCGKSYEVDFEEYERCPHCGQRIDWGMGDE